MNRRTVIRNLVVVSAGASLIPSCIQEEKPIFPLKNMVVTGPQQELLAALTETIIPRTSGFPGATDLKAHEFLLTMMDDCAKPEEQQSFINGLHLFEEAFKKKANTSYVKASVQQRNAFLKELEANKNNKDDLTGFYKTVKRHTLQAFTTSKEYLVGVRKFTLVPGSNFKGCVPVGKAEAKKST